MLGSSLCDYSDAYILAKGNMIVTNQEKQQPQIIQTKNVIFKNWAALSDCISETSNTEIDYAKNIDVVMLMYTYYTIIV